MARFNLDEYVDVQERINRFWEKYPEGYIETHVDENAGCTPEYIVICAEVGIYDDAIAPIREGRAVKYLSRRTLATGIAAEHRAYVRDRGQPGHSHVNETSWVENCETSAIGRALANLGGEFVKSAAERPSRQEMAKVERHDQQPQQARRYDPPSGPQGQQERRSVGNPDAEPTESQMNYVKGLLDRQGYGNAEMRDGVVGLMYGVPFSAMTRGQMSDLIEQLKAGNVQKAVDQPPLSAGGSEEYPF